MIKENYKNILVSIFALMFFYSKAYSQDELIKTIYFKSNSFSIGKEYYKTLNLIAKQLNSDSFAFLKVFGYADTKGSDDYNDVLSGKRVNAVYGYLSSHVKLDTAKVYMTWLGKSAEAYDLHFPSAHVQRRCVDIWVSFYKKPKAEKP